MRKIPPMLLPRDGRFGSGPAKIRPEALQALNSVGTTLLGTSHRQRPVRRLVGAVRENLHTLYQLPEDYTVVLGNGGASQFWDIAVCSLIRERSAHGIFGEFTGKFADAVAAAPHLAEPVRHETAPGSVALPHRDDDVDVQAWAHNETSTGALAPTARIHPTALTLIDGTSAAGAVPVDPADFDVYYFAPQKAFASDGGLWFALCSPAAVERMQQIAATDRWIPTSLSLQAAYDNSLKDQTVNTPALATLVLMQEQLAWVLENGGLPFAAGRSADSAQRVYQWAETHPNARPFVEPQFRSPVVATIDFDDSIDAAELAAELRANEVVDVEPYRKLGRNQLRLGLFPAVEPEDVARLLGCIDWLIAHPQVAE